MTPMTTTPTDTEPAAAAAAAAATAAVPEPAATPWQITGGQPTDEETAALAAVLTALLVQQAAVRPGPARPVSTDTVWDRPRHAPRVRTGSWRAR